MKRNYQTGRPDLEYPNFRILLDDIAERYADNIAIHMPDRQSGEGNSYRRWNFREFADTTRQLARYLTEILPGRDERVALVSENRPEWIFTWFAAVISGRVIVPIDAGLDPQGMRTILRESGARMLFASRKSLEKLSGGQAAAEVMQETPELETIICFDGVEDEEAALPWAKIMAKDWKGELPPAEEISPDDSASIIYTSGTTGTAKGVVLSHRGIIMNAVASIVALPIDQNDVFAGVLPFHHTYPTTCCVVSPLMVGGSVSIVDRIVGPVIISIIRETGGTIMIGVPLLYDKIRGSMQVKLASVPGPAGNILKTMQAFSRFANDRFGRNPGKVLFRSLREKAGMTTLRLMVSGGGPLNPETAAFFESLGFTIRQGYGMSENGPLITTNTITSFNNRSVGLPVLRTEIRISEPNDEGIGEIQVKSPSLMKGYFRNAEATREIMTEDGFLRTGDLGYFDAKGFLYISGRSKNLIVTPGGKNVYPEEIEEHFTTSPHIAEVIVVGDPAGRGDGENVSAAFFPDYDYLREKFGEKADTDSFIRDLITREVQEVNRKLPGYKKISRFTIRKSDFEKTSSKKIKRYVYRNFDSCQEESAAV